jgi:hypothetical protein
MQTIDFGRSYLTFRIDLEAQAAITLSHVPPTTVNNARIQLECVCSIEHKQSQVTTQYVLGASCKTERVGASQDLWTEPNADFCLIASQEDFLIIKSWQKRDLQIPRYPANLGLQTERQSGKVSEAWASFRLDIRPVSGHALQSPEAIIEATFRNSPLVARTEYSDGDFNVRLEYPVKTFNVSEKEMIYQTDTGPLMIPDFSPQRLSSMSPLVECFDLGYSAFNCPDWIELILNVPTPLVPSLTVDHYSKVRRIERVKNTLIEIP